LNYLKLQHFVENSKKIKVKYLIKIDIDLKTLGVYL